MRYICTDSKNASRSHNITKNANVNRFVVFSVNAKLKRFLEACDAARPPVSFFLVFFIFVFITHNLCASFLMITVIKEQSCNIILNIATV